MSQNLKLSFATRVLSAFGIAATTVVSMSSAMAINVPPAETAPAEVKPRVYKSAQGTIDLAKLEAVLTNEINAKTEVVSIRWSRNPFDYAAYAGGWIVQLADKEEGPSGYYNLKIKIDDTHIADCELSLRSVKEEFTVGSCASDTAKVTTYFYGDYSLIGLPKGPVKPTY